MKLVPKWLLTDYDGAEKDMADFLEVALVDEIYLDKAVQMLKGKDKLIAGYIFKGFSAQAIADSMGKPGADLAEKVDQISNQIDINKSILKADETVRARITAEAKAKAMERTDQLPDLAERAFIYQAHMAEQEGWFTLLDGEYDTLIEFMLGHLSSYDQSRGDGRYYNMDFLIRTLLPFLQSQGIEPKRLYGLSSAPTKAWLIVPAARHGWELYENSPKKLTKYLMELVGWVINPTMTTSDIREKVSKLKKAKQHVEDIITSPGEVFVLPGAKGGQRFVLIIEVDNQVQSEIVQRTLKKVIPEGFRVGDFSKLGKNITNLLSDPNKYSLLEDK